METPTPQYKPAQRKALPFAGVSCTEALSQVTMARVSAALHSPWPDRRPTPGQLPKSDIPVLSKSGSHHHAGHHPQEANKEILEVRLQVNKVKCMVFP